MLPQAGSERGCHSADTQPLQPRRARQRRHAAQVAGKRWVVDLNARQEATLQLSSVNLPGGVQVRCPAPCRAPRRVQCSPWLTFGSTHALCALKRGILWHTVQRSFVPKYILTPKVHTYSICTCCYHAVSARLPPEWRARRAQRRRTAEDELNMRSVFEEGDLISVRRRPPPNPTHACLRQDAVLHRACPSAHVLITSYRQVIACVLTP